jgi:hypothetical protein
MTDPTDNRALTIGEFQQVAEGLTWADLDASPIAECTADEIDAMTPGELKEMLRSAESN